MIERPTKTEIMLEKLAGPAVLGWSAFLFTVFVGILSVPVTLLSLVSLKAYKWLLWLHWSGEESIAAISDRFNGRQK